jgi:hypothetical protein
VQETAKKSQESGSGAKGDVVISPGEGNRGDCEASG